MRRRRQVIGGDLSGVAHRRARNRLAKLTGFNIANWVAVAVVVLILTAFFWPQPKPEAIREINNPDSPIESESFYSESRIDDASSSQAPLQTFSRDDDLQRADQFRVEDEMARRIRGLLQLAQQQVQRRELTLPEDSNATQTYRQVLLLSPNNASAREGLDFIRGRFLTLGLAALNDGNQGAAEAALSKLAIVNRDADEYQELNNAIENWKTQQRVAAWLEQASDAIEDDRLLLPARNNALYFYQRAQSLDSNNNEVASGIAAIADTFIDRAAKALTDGQTAIAAGHLTTVSVIDPAHPSLPLLEAQLARARQAELTESQTQPNGSRPAPVATPNTTSARVVSPPRSRESREQAEINRQYLQRGLDAYYKGDYANAAALLQPLADRGISRAQLRLGYMHFLGRGFPADRDEADRIIRAALPAVQKFAAEGRSWAQSDIGSLYEDGLVLPRDYRQAVDWYRRAADQGYPGAQTNLGLMYARGRGVSSSRRTAIEWFQRAAKQGDVVARRNLETMGVTQ